MRGYTLGEALVSIGMFTLLAAALFAVLRSGTAAWLRVDTLHDAEFSLRRVESHLLRDVESAAGNVNVAPIGPGDGCALWFPTGLTWGADGQPQVARGELGELYGVDTILYYAMRPPGDSCDLDPDDLPQGDRYCPHKVVVRKVIAGKPALDAATVLGTWCTREPSGLGTLLIFAPAQDPVTRKVTVQLTGFRTREAQKSIRLGSAPLDGERFAVPHSVRLFPGN